LNVALGPPPRPGAPAPQRAQDGAAITSSVIHDVRVWSVWLVLGLVLVAVAVAWVVAGRMLRPLRRVTETAERVSGAGDGRRIALDGPADELKQLADTIDSMLDRVDRSSEAQRHFVSDASHELRTPLAAMAVEVDVALDSPDIDPDEMREALRGVRENVRRAQGLVESLLVLARAGALQRTGPCDLAASAQRATDTATRLHPDARFELDCQPAVVDGDQALLDRMVANLVENAVRYSTPSTTIRLATRVEGADAVFTIDNDCPPLSVDVNSLFERFRRGDSSRAASSGGAGLGLAIVSDIVAAHRGTLSARAPRDGGMHVEVRIGVSHID
jgi:signal transduction histidine kinase